MTGAMKNHKNNVLPFPKPAAEPGAALCGDSLALLRALPNASTSLVMTSPPFARQRRKAYGNKDQVDYIDWLTQFRDEPAVAHQNSAR